MADSSKRDKIAAAKKKLKQFQQKSGRTPSSSPARPPSNKTSREKSNKENITNAVGENKSVVSYSDNSVPEHKKPDDTDVRLPRKSRENIPNEAPHLEWFNPARPTSSTESLQQLSRQINGLLAETVDFVDGEEMETNGNTSIAELEKRNRDLAALLEKHSAANEQLNVQVEQARSHAKTLQDQLDQERDGFDDKHKKDVGSLKEQLQVHIQTIGILVAEKTELQSQVSQSQRIAEQRLDEIEELSGRLKASRQRVADLERNFGNLSQSSQQHEKVNRESSKEIDRLKMDLYKANKSKEELQQQTSELTEKLNAKVQECGGLDQSVLDLKKRLEMAEVYAQQLSSETETSGESVKIVEQLQVERDSLIAKLHQYNESFHKVSEEKEQISEQYRHYTEQLQRQSQELSHQVSGMTEERDKLLARQHELEATALELQRKLEDVATEKSVQEVIPTEVTQELEHLRAEHQDLLTRHDAQVRDNAQLSRFVEEKEDRISELESVVQTMGEEAGDKASLLENIQSDKTALSRALTQNKDLKQQLAELQSGFVKLSNENMEMMTRLQGEEHSGNELGQRLAQQEDEIKELRESITKKERELTELQKVVAISQREEYQQDQIQDRLRHYEAQAQLVDTLQNELTSAQDMMDALTTQNRELRAMLIKATEVKNTTDNSMDTIENDSTRDSVIDSLQSTIGQMENERTQLVESLKEQRDLSDSLGIKVADLQEELIRKSQDNLDNDIITRADYDQLKTALEMITEKYTRVMRDKAELCDKAEMLEHMVTQLQGETDTIGEYISLYHHQRALLQQREHQKNEYITQLARDREEMQGKLGQLQALVMQLLGERNMLHSYTEESTREASPENTPVVPSSHPHKHKHHHHHHHHQNHRKQNNLTNGVSDSYEWPDYTSSESDSESEVEPIVGGSQDTAPDSPTEDINQSRLATPPSPSQSEDMHQPMHIHDDSHMHDHGHQTVQEDDQTAHRILHLLSELGHSNLVEKAPFTERNFLPCKYCSGPVHIV